MSASVAKRALRRLLRLPGRCIRLVHWDSYSVGGKVGRLLRIEDDETLSYKMPIDKEDLQPLFDKGWGASTDLLTPCKH